MRSEIVIFGKTIEILHKKQERGNIYVIMFIQTLTNSRDWTMNTTKQLPGQKQRAAQFNITKPKQLTDVQHKKKKKHF